jgi:predicted nuclease of predicted toxin-antitoxin system
VKALIDEQLSPDIARLLRDRGHDVEAVAERPDLVGRPDRVIFEVAAAEGRAVVTNNVKDFRPLAAERLTQGRTHPGLILLPSARTRTRSAVSALADAIEGVLMTKPGDLTSSERWIGPLSNR